MKKVFVLIFLFGFHILYSQTFTWLKGTNTINQVGLYGTLSTPSATNHPGSRHAAATWVDAQGNLWLFGGEGYSNTAALCWLNDLWKYDVQTNSWTWVSGSNGSNQIGSYGTMGIPAPTNHPGAREFSVYWTDAAGNFWLFGGDGFASNATFGKLGDLWKYNPLTNIWTWMSGFNTVNQNGQYGALGVPSATTIPGCRYGSGSWADGNGNLWLFGGRGMPAAGPDGHLNDLWKYSTATNQWTWMGGSNLVAQNGVYGTLNVPSAANSPGGNEFPSCWYDAGNLYLFGGRGYNGAGGASYLNSFWKYNTVNNQWTWIGGVNGANPTGAYGTLGVPSATNIPGGRMSAASWSDNNGNLFIFGGLGVPATAGVGDLNDLFSYNINNNQWTWLKGSTAAGQNGVYGTLGVSSFASVPGGRHYNTFWKRSNTEFWLLGGQGYAASTGPDNMEDLWKLVPSCQPQTLSTSQTSVCSGNTITLSAASNGTTAVSWYTVPVAGTSVGSGTSIITPTLATTAASNIVTYYAESTACFSFPRTSITITVYASPSLSINGATAICVGNSISLTVSGTANTYSWSTGSSSISILETPLNNTVYTLTGTANNGCATISTHSITVHPLPSLSSVGGNSVCIGSSTIISLNTSANSYTWSNNATTPSVSVNPSITSQYSVVVQDNNGCINTITHTVQVLGLPNIAINGSSVICVGESTSLTALGGTAYSWFNNQTATVIIVSPATNTVYSVIGSNNNGCSNTASISLQVSGCVFISETEKNNKNFCLYPNPSSGELFLNSMYHESGHFLIYDALGQIVLLKEIKHGVTKIELSFQKGVYFFYYVDSKNKTIERGKLVLN